MCSMQHPHVDMTAPPPTCLRVLVAPSMVAAEDRRQSQGVTCKNCQTQFCSGNFRCMIAERCVLAMQPLRHICREDPLQGHLTCSTDSTTASVLSTDVRITGSHHCLTRLPRGAEVQRIVPSAHECTPRIRNIIRS